MIANLENVIDARKEVLIYYSPYSYLKDMDAATQFNAFVKEKIHSFYNGANTNQFCYEAIIHDIEFNFLYELLEWDTAFFKIKSYKLFTVLYSQSNANALTAAIEKFRQHLSAKERVYIFIDIPAEDILLIQCLGMAGFKMTETRLHFYKDNVAAFNEERYEVRSATIEDVPAVAYTARSSRNVYDRLHADTDFSDEVADDYLAEYATAAINGYCDDVLVPAAAGLPVDAFLAISNIKEAAFPNCTLSRIVLTAAGPANKGWHKKLVSETIHYARERGASYVLMTTQSTNRAVFRTAEKLGLKLGAGSHIFSYSK